MYSSLNNFHNCFEKNQHVEGKGTDDEIIANVDMENQHISQWTSITFKISI